MTAPAIIELGEVAAFVRGITFKPDDVVPVGTPGTAACMRTKNVQAELDLSDVWGIPEAFVRREDQYLIPGDMLVSSANSWNLVGKCCWVPDLPWRSTFGGFISVLRPNSAKVDPRYLFRWFASDRTQATVRSFGQQTTNISNLNVDRCLKLKLRLPPLPEQRRIAEILDKADALRAKRRAALAQLDTLTQSIFLDMFGDPRKKGSTGRVPTKQKLLGELTRIRTGKLDANAADEDGTYPFFTCAVEILRINTAAFECKAVLVAGNGDLNVKYFEGKFNAYQRTYVIESLDESRLVPQFLYAFLDLYVSELRKQAIGGVIKYIKLPYLTDAVVQLPSEVWQREFANRLGVVEKLKAAQCTSLEELNAVFASLQHRAFRGEL